MNGKIMIGAGAAVIAWGAVAFTYQQAVTGAVLMVAGIAIFVLGLRQTRRGR